MSLEPMLFHAMPSCPGGVVSCITPQRLAGEDPKVELIVVVALMYCVALFHCVLCASRICLLLLCHSWLIALPDHLLWGGAPDHSSQMLPKEKCRQCWC